MNTVYTPDDLGGHIGPTVPMMEASDRFRAVAIAIAICAAAAVVMVIAAGLFLFRSSTSSSDAEQGGIGPGPDHPANAPKGDIFVRLAPGAGRGPLGEQILDRNQEADFVPGSVVHVATAISQFGETELLEWQSTERFEDQQGAVLCSGAFSETGAMYGCGSGQQMLGNLEPSVGWGSSGGEPGTPSRQSATVDNLPGEVVWMIVKTTDGALIVANTVGSVGFAEWDGTAGEAGTVFLLDAAQKEVWSENLRRP